MTVDFVIAGKRTDHIDAVQLQFVAKEVGQHARRRCLESDSITGSDHNPEGMNLCQ